MNGGSCTCSATMRDGQPMVYDTSRCPIHSSAGSRVTGVDADLATLRDACYMHIDTDLGGGMAANEERLAALARVEAELARLREELSDIEGSPSYHWYYRTQDERERAEAAEARCAEAEQDRNEYIDIAEREAARCARLQQALDPLDQFEYDLAYWQKAYPTSVFGEDLTDDEQRAVTQALESAGFTSDRVHASWARHITRSITEQYAPVKAAREALAGPDTPAGAREALEPS